MTALTASTATPTPQPWLWPLCAVMLIFGWSSGFIGIRFANEEAPVLLVLFWRTLLSGLILLPFALTLGPRLRRGAVLYQMAFGTMAVFLYLGGFALAIEARVPTGLVALISDLLPLAIAALSQPVLAERLKPHQWIGTAIAVLGVGIVSFDSLALGTAPLWAYGLTVASMLVFALASVLHKRVTRDPAHAALHMPVHQALCLQCLIGAALFGLSRLATGASLAPPLTPHFALGMGWLVLVATFATYSVYYTSLRLFPAARVSAAIYLSPPFTMALAWALFDEPLSPSMFAGLAVTLLGVALTMRG